MRRTLDIPTLEPIFWVCGPSGGPRDGDSEESEEGGSGVAIEEGRPDLKEPRKYAVVLHNDDYTTMEFVIEILARFFNKTQEQAVQITLQVHRQGKGIAGVYSHEIAETKVEQVTQYARGSGYPLKCTAEPL